MSDCRPDRRASADRSSTGATEETVDVDGLLDDLDRIAGSLTTSEARRELAETEQLLRQAGERGLVDVGVRRLDARDAAEAFVGSVIFATPLLVEDGIFDIADHLLAHAVAGVPVFLVANVLFVVGMTYALVEWTGRNRPEASRLLRIVPGRVLMILAVSLAVTAALMTLWGRLDGWGSPTVALARVSVVWTVGSLGAALGDILSTGDPTLADATEADATEADATEADATEADPATTGPPVDASGPELVVALDRQFDELERAVVEPATRREVRRMGDGLLRAAADSQFGDRIRKYTSRDVAEAFVGSVFFAIPLLVENGVFDVAAYFLSFRAGLFPVFFVANAAFVLLMVAALVFWAGPQDVRAASPLFGVVPRRLIGIPVVAFVTAAALMTLWGRVDGWQDPAVAIARISAVWTVASFGAALGDILPGESSGEDITENLAALGEQVEALVEREG